MNELINQFLQKQKVVSICCLDEENYPYCFNCFYAFDAINNLLHFKSSGSSYHAQLLVQKKQLAGTVLPDKINVLAIKGIQFTGRLINAEEELAANASFVYHKKFPFAIAIAGDVFTIQLDKVKMVDNSKGFGKKITWNRNKTTSPA